ncbi:hypothetical protein TELCIR_07349, partial [Teladorsagia circumcincta]
ILEHNSTQDAFSMDPLWSGILMLLLGVIGLFPLIFVVVQPLATRRRLHPFQYLMLSKLAADGIELLVPLLCLSASQLLLDVWQFCSGQWLDENKKPIVGYLALSLQYSSIYTSVAMTVNRTIAVTFPQEYKKWFNNKATMIWIAACWLIAWTHNVVHLKDKCPSRHSFGASTARLSRAARLLLPAKAEVVTQACDQAAAHHATTQLRLEAPKTVTSTVDTFLAREQIGHLHEADKTQHGAIFSKEQP